MRTKSAQNGFSLLVLYVLLCMHCGSFAQSKSLRQYYYWINQAELAICDSNFQRASDCYDKAFSIHRPFGGHASFAYRVNADYLHDTVRIVQCFHYLAQMGDPIEWYVEDTIQQVSLYHLLKKVADTTKVLVDTRLQQAMEKICDDDSRVRQNWNPFDTVQLERIDSMDAVNLQKVKKLYKQYKNINDYNLGMSSAAANLVLKHNCNRILFNPKKLWLKEVKKGNLEASRYMILEDYCHTAISRAHGRGKATLYGINVDYSFIIDGTLFVVQPAKLKQINRNRKKLGMSETWEDYCKKIWYLTEENEDHFSIYPRNSIFYPDDEAHEKAEELKQKMDKDKNFGWYKPDRSL
ncbi:MAG: hypothetical protein IJU33_06580 [Bacteroidales bacterium]|nr:hypothetical protein [Bacteroidales bacterium]